MWGTIKKYDETDVRFFYYFKKKLYFEAEPKTGKMDYRHCQARLSSKILNYFDKISLQKETI